MRVTITPIESLKLSDFRRCWELCDNCEDYGYTRWALKRWLAGIYEKRWCVLCREGGRIVGWALVTRMQKGTWVDFKIYVDPDHRRKGIGKRIALAAEKRFGTLGHYSPNKGAKAFWAKLGMD